METVELKFNDKIISFEKDQKNVMVNATQMAKVFEKEVTHFIQNDGTEKFINVCLKTRNSEFLGIKNREDLVTGKQKSGTWMHRILAYKFAAWLNPEFELWVYLQIDEILYNYAKTQEDSITRTVILKKEIDTRKKLLLTNNKEYEEIVELEEKLKEAKAQRSNSTKSKFKQVYDLFNQPE